MPTQEQLIVRFKAPFLAIQVDVAGSIELIDPNCRWTMAGCNDCADRIAKLEVNANGK